MQPSIAGSLFKESRGNVKKVLLIVMTALFLFHGTAQAVPPPVLYVITNAIEIDFPTSVTFVAELDSSTDIQKVKLHYGTVQDTCGNVSALALPDFTPGDTVSVEWTWDMRQSGSLVPGATLWWYWEIVDSQGNSGFSDVLEQTWIDDVHPWKTLSEGMIRLHYYYDDVEYGETLKDAAVTALARLNEDLGMTTQEPIDLYIYSTNEDLQDAILYEPGWTGGLAYSDFNVVLIGIEPYNLDWGIRTEAHEMTHILEGDYSFSCNASSPTWLSEGLAVYGEGGPDSMEADHFNQAVREDAVLSFNVLSGGFSEDPDQADLSYSQSYYMVTYLLDTYGKENLLELLSLLKNAGELSQSLQTAYGFDLAGFENEWRTYYDLAPLDEVALVATPFPTIIPTIIPIQGAQSVPVALAVTPSPTPTEPQETIEPSSSEASSNNPPSADNWIAEFRQNSPSWLPTALLLVAGSCVLVVIIALIATRKKGGRQ